MSPARKAQGPIGAIYERHRPEQTLLYQLIHRYYPEFEALMAAQDRPLPAYVCQEFEDYLRCGRLEHGFLRVRCEACKHEKLVAFSCKRRGFCPSCGARRMVESAALLVDEVLPKEALRQWVLSVPFPLRFLFASYPHVMGKALGIVYRTLATHLVHKAGFTHPTARTGAVTFIQRFGSALNLNVHFHMVFLDGVYVTGQEQSTPVFRRVKGPSPAELQALVQKISVRLCRYLVREGLLTQDMENSYLSLEQLEDRPMQHVHGHSITYRVAVGPRQGSKVFTLQTLPAKDPNGRDAQVGKAGGFSLHAGVAIRSHQRGKLERLCRYVARPAVAEQRLGLTRDGRVRYQLKTPYRDGTTHVIFEPLDFIARLAALVPKPRVNLVRYHGVFAPNSQYRVTITPAGRGKGSTRPGTDNEERTPMERRAAITCTQRA
jgi:ribosomal protein S27E